LRRTPMTEYPIHLDEDTLDRLFDEDDADID
jgi:hypothetical protein